MWVIVTESDEGVVVPKFRVHGPYDSWSDADEANLELQGEIHPVERLETTAR